MLLIVDGRELITFADPLLSVHGHLWLPLATGKLVGNNREFDVIDIFCGVLIIVGRVPLYNIEDSSLVTLSLV